MATMTDPIPSAGETTIIGLPAITVPVTSTGDRPLTKEDLETIMLLDEDEITVGRDPRADILLDDSTVSRAHAVFRRSDGRYSVIDAGSLNGTYVNRQRVDQQELKNGDEIILGKFRLVYFDNKAVIAG